MSYSNYLTLFVVLKPLGSPTKTLNAIAPIKIGEDEYSGFIGDEKGDWPHDWQASVPTGHLCFYQILFKSDAYGIDYGKLAANENELVKWAKTICANHKCVCTRIALSVSRL